MFGLNQVHTLGKGGKDLIPIEQRRKQSEDGRNGKDASNVKDKGEDSGEDEGEDEEEENEDDDSAPLQLTKVCFYK